MTKPLLRTTALGALLMAVALHAGAAIDLNSPVPIGPQVKVGHLPNGLTYYIQKNIKPEHRAELRLVVKAGSILEDDDQQGLAHFTEHMAFNGSTHFKKHELISYLQSIGVKFGADLNAYTSFDETVYILPIPTDNKANLDKALTVLEDWAGGVSFTDADIDKERDIVLEEARLGKGAGDRMNRKLLPKLFNGSRYSERLPIGKEDILRTFPHDAVRRFYRDWYRPDLMAVVAVGDFDGADVEKLIKQHFGKLKNPAHERPRVWASIPPRDASEGAVITDKEANNSTIYIRYPVHEWQDDGSFREYRRSLVEQLFSTMLNQRLQELAQQASPPFVGGSSAEGKLVRGYKSYSSLAVLARGGAQPAIDALVQENERARQFGFTAAELERARKDMMRGFERAYAERDKTDSGSYASEYIRNFLEQEPVPGIAAEFGYAQELLPGITLDEMNRFARETIPSRSPKLVAYLGSDKAELPIPSGEALLAAVDAAEKKPVVAHSESAVGAKLMDTPPQAGRIIGETQDAALGTTTLTLSNGVKVILKPTDFRNDQVLLSAARFGGQSLFEDKDIYNARYANAVVATMGVNGYSPTDLQKVLAGQAASARFILTPYTDNIAASAGSTDVEAMLQLVYLHFTKLRRDENLYKSFIGRQQDLARNALSQPESQFRDAIYSTLYNHNPRVGLTARPEDFAKVDLERSMQVFRDRFGSAKDLTFVMVGSFEIDKIKPLLATYLASLPVTDIPVQFRDVGIRPVQGVVKKEVRAGTEPKSTVSMTFTGTTEYSEEEQMRFYALMEVMNLRITDVLREKLTLIYGGGLNGSFSKYPYPNYTISGGLPCGPDNVDKVIAAVQGEIAQLKAKGPDEAELNKVKQNWLQNHAKALRENDYWLSRIQNALLNGTDPHSVLQYRERVDAITPADIKAAAQHYFNLQNYVQVVLKPEAGGPAAPAATTAAAAVESK